jgi:glycerophosphoryl diester phosphodiesterase
LRYPRASLLVEVKIPLAAEPTRRILQRCDAMRRTLVDSADHNVVAALRGSEVITGASLPEVVRLLGRSLVGQFPIELPYAALCVPLSYYGMRVPVTLLGSAGRRAHVVTHVWTVNDCAVARRLWTSGVNGIVTDDPGPLVELRRSVFAADQRTA